MHILSRLQQSQADGGQGLEGRLAATAESACRAGLLAIAVVIGSLSAERLRCKREERQPTMHSCAAKNNRWASMLPGLDGHHNDDGHNDGHDNESNAEPFPGVLVQPLGVHKRGGALLHVLHALGHLQHSR